MNKKLFIKTYGCQMNVYDSQKMEELITPHGYSLSDNMKESNLVIINTCHIREKAAEKMYSELGRIAKIKAKSEEMIVVVAGCVGQAEGDEVLKRAPCVDIVVGPHSFVNLIDLINKVKRDKVKLVNLEFQEEEKFDKLSANDNNQSKVSSFLSIQEGCDKFCTFCVVPYTRGAEFSRPVNKIYREALQLAENGAKEIQLLGQNVNGYNGLIDDNKKYNLGQLIDHLTKINQLERIRYTTSHPIDMHQELYEIHKHPKVMPFLHLPVQSGSNKILQKMNRKHNRDAYFKIIEKLKFYRPEIAFSSDFIVGFPNETDQDFEDTMDLVRRVNFAQAYSFIYSARPGTPASNIEDEISMQVKKQRLTILQELLTQQQLEFNDKFQNKELSVLIESFNSKSNNLYGKSQYMQSVYINNASEELIGKVVNVKIKETGFKSLYGDIV